MTATATVTRSMPGTAFTRAEARRALKTLDTLLDTEEGFRIAREAGAVNQIYAALIVLDDYLSNSKPVPLTKPERSRWEIHAEQVGARGL